MVHCAIHPDEELVETYPADVENGPHPNDVYNELVCPRCEIEVEIAVLNSMCIEHRLHLVDCPPCYYADAGDPFSQEAA